MTIDAHIHYADDDPEFLSLLDKLDLKLLNICYVPDTTTQWRTQADLYRPLAHTRPDRFAWCTSFDLPRFDLETFERDQYVKEVIQALQVDFAAGAVACKAWKNIGMDLRKADGSFVLIDDPIFEPIFDFIAAQGRTLVMHMAEPLACWQPLDANSPHYSYYKNNPEWHMVNRPEVPSHGQIIAARDRVVERHPALRVVGAHLGSLEHDVDEVAVRLDRYPNFAVDSSARLGDLARQPSVKVRRFFERYADRILFGTDIVMRTRPSAMPEPDKVAALAMLYETYRMHFAYFEGSGPVTVRGCATEGLGLPQAVLDKLYIENARCWYPGV